LNMDRVRALITLLLLKIKRKSQNGFYVTI